MFRKCLLGGGLWIRTPSYTKQSDRHTLRDLLVWRLYEVHAQGTRRIQSNRRLLYPLEFIGLESRWNMIIQETHWMESWIPIKERAEIEPIPKRRRRKMCGAKNDSTALTQGPICTANPNQLRAVPTILTNDHEDRHHHPDSCDLRPSPSNDCQSTSTELRSHTSSSRTPPINSWVFLL